jgi:hypothetical protein
MDRFTWFLVVALSLAIALGVCVAWKTTPDMADRSASRDVAGTRRDEAPSAQTATAVPVPTPAPVVDPVGSYLAMRDDVNAIARLRFVEDRVRTTDADPTTVELLGTAMVDPDERVRDRAQVLYDRALAARAVASH